MFRYGGSITILLVVTILFIAGCENEESGERSQEKASTPETTAESAAAVEQTSAKTTSPTVKTKAEPVQGTTPSTASPEVAKKAKTATDVEATVMVSSVVDAIPLISHRP